VVWLRLLPGNLTRFLPSLPGYVYAQRQDEIFVNLFAGGTADIRLDDGRKIILKQETSYPWDGAVRISVTPEKKTTFTLSIRIPGWARNEPVPGDLYKFAETNTAPVTLKVDGKNVKFTIENGYAKLDRRCGPAMWWN